MLSNGMFELGYEFINLDGWSCLNCVVRPFPRSHSSFSVAYFVTLPHCLMHSRLLGRPLPHSQWKHPTRPSPLSQRHGRARNLAARPPAQAGSVCHSFFFSSFSFIFRLYWITQACTPALDPPRVPQEGASSPSLARLATMPRMPRPSLTGVCMKV
jgi:hypothetical protein